jgi:ATP-dependent DNA helicase DinG
MLMRQGAGRLIRRSEDRGVIALLDPRLRTKGYGEQFFENLPPGIRSFDDIYDAVAHAGI